ncbi:MAG: uroporphyrinogen-III synthase [Ilumatobacter sp.]|nr:uroporphyrinogen-III synthase [Ilumatobacter sp.]
MAADSGDRPLRGIRVVTTRERPGQLDRSLTALGAEVVHVPLIETTDPVDGGAALRAELARADEYDWVIVTSPVGAERALPAIGGADVRLATVGTKTAEVAEAIVGRPVDVVPARQLAAALVEAMPTPTGPERVLLAVADRADPATAAALGERGYDVTSVVAYRTLLRHPTADERAVALGADLVAFASGSAATSWADAIGTETPPHVVSIGPSTTAAAEARGLRVTTTATDHSIDGLVAAIVQTATSAS